MHTWLRTQPKSSFADGIRKLVGRSNKCVEKLRITSKNDSIFVVVCLSLNKENNKLNLLFEFNTYIRLLSHDTVS
jgi:hypothetical protein